MNDNTNEIIIKFEQTKETSNASSGVANGNGAISNYIQAVTRERTGKYKKIQQLWFHFKSDTIKGLNETDSRINYALNGKGISKL